MATMCVQIEDKVDPSPEVQAALASVLGECHGRRGQGRSSGRPAGCAGCWRLRVEKNLSSETSQAAWGLMARLLRVDLPGSGEVVEDFLVRVADLADLPGA